MTPRILPLLGLLALGSFACSQANDEGPTPPVTFDVARSSLARDTTTSLAPSDAAAFSDANVDFALRMHRALAEKKGNLAVSPYSIGTALAMTWAGATGETAAEMQKTLGFTLGQDKTHVGMNALSRTLATRAGEGKATDGSPLKLAVDNAIFTERGLALETPFLDTLARSYGSGAFLADFRSKADAERGRINQWVASNTADRVRSLLPEGSLDATTRVVLVNTIYMNAAWELPFAANATGEAPFTNESGTTSTVQTMARTFDSPHLRTDDVDLVTLPYSGGKLAMTVILPRKQTLAAFEKTLDQKQLAKLLLARTEGTFDLKMPRFKISGDSVSLKDVLTALGMKRAFTSAAELDGITRSEQLKISDVVHKAFIDVAEKGTEAAAATAVIATETSAPPEPEVRFVFDRPFMVLIHDAPTGAILFTARVAQP